jgi:hypothetical protein
MLGILISLIGEKTMKGKWSGIGVTQGSGKLGGNVATKNAYADVWRVKVNPINRNSPDQSQIRSTFATHSSAWSQVLTENERNAWIGFSANHEFAMAFGSKRSLKGKEMFVKINQFLSNAGLTTSTTPPTDLTTGELGKLTLVANHTGPVLTVATIENGVPSTAVINFFATGLVNNGRNSVTSLMRYIGTLPSAGSPYNIAALWTAKFGTFPTGAGQKIAVLAQVITDEGWAGIPATTASFVI